MANNLILAISFGLKLNSNLKSFTKPLVKLNRHCRTTGLWLSFFSQKLLLRKTQKMMKCELFFLFNYVIM